jgi:hypothetical protein
MNNMYRKINDFEEYSYTWKMRFPYINFYTQKIYTKKLADDGFYAVNIDPYTEWKLSGRIDSEDFIGWSGFPQIFQKHVNRLKKDPSNIHIKAFVMRWDGSKKEIPIR